MGGIKSRKSPRAQVSLVARYRSPTAFEFVHEECFDLSAGGMFIKSRAPAPSGTLLKLECDVDSGVAKIRGVARVVWLRELESDGHPAGMGVKFVKLDAGGREVISAILDRVGVAQDEAGVARRSSVPPRGSQPYRPSPLPSLGAVPSPAPKADATGTTPAPAAQLEDAGVDAITLPPTVPPPAPTKIASPAPAAPQQAARPMPAVEPPTKTAESKAKAPEPNKAKAAEPKGKGKGKGKKGGKGSNKQQAKAGTADPAKPSTSGRPAVAPRAAEPAPAARGKRALVYVAAAAIAAIGTYVIVSRRAPDPESTTVVEETATNAPEPVAPEPEPQVAAAPEPAPEPQVAVSAAPVEPTAPTPTPEPEAAPAPNYVLEIVTRPEGARVSIGDQHVVTPGELQLGALAEPIVVKAEKEGFLSAAATIDRVGFMLDEGTMRRRVVFKLSEAKEAATEAPKKSRRDKPAPAEDKPKSAEPALAAVAHAEPKPMPPEGDKPEPKAVKQTAMQTAMACLGNGDNACVVTALEGKAKTAQELELLIETHRAMGHTDKAEQYMQSYVSKFPAERRAASYQRVLERRAGGPAAP